MKRARSPAPSSVLLLMPVRLRTCSVVGHDVAARAYDVRRAGVHSRLDAVGGGSGGGHADGAGEARVDALQTGGVRCIAGGRGHVRVVAEVREVRLGIRNRRTNVGGGRLGLGAILEAEVRR